MCKVKILQKCIPDIYALLLYCYYTYLTLPEPLARHIVFLYCNIPILKNID